MSRDGSFKEYRIANLYKKSLNLGTLLQIIQNYIYRRKYSANKYV